MVKTIVHMVQNNNSADLNGANIIFYLLPETVVIKLSRYDAADEDV